MTKLIFLEGVSGVGKSTMAKKMCEDLRSEGKNANSCVLERIVIKYFQKTLDSDVAS